MSSNAADIKVGDKSLLEVIDSLSNQISRLEVKLGQCVDNVNNTPAQAQEPIDQQTAGVA